MDNFERPFFVSKTGLDTTNSITWFLADGLWMLGFFESALFCLSLTLLTGLVLIYIEKRFSVTCINIAIICWTSMNFVWILSEYKDDQGYQAQARIAFAAGLGFIMIAILASKNVRETFSHFKRFRSPKIE